MAPRTQNPTERFEDKLLLAILNHTNGCWDWPGAKRRGYGVFALTHKKIVPAHRYSYELYFGKIPDGYELDHLCKNKGCVNPFHLEPVTHKENGFRSNQVSGVNARKTNCPQGHPLSGDNLCKAQLKEGHRQCRTCWNVRSRRNYSRRVSA